MKKLLLTTACLSLTASAGFAELTNQQIVDMFPGATKIEIERGATTTEVEAIVGSQKFEVVFDNVTDQELTREVKTLTEQQQADETDDSGDLEDDSSDDDGDDGDDNEDDSDDNEDDSDDDHGDDHDADHDGGDDDHGDDD